MIFCHFWKKAGMFDWTRFWKKLDFFIEKSQISKMKSFWKNIKWNCAHFEKHRYKVSKNDHFYMSKIGHSGTVKFWSKMVKNRPKNVEILAIFLKFWTNLGPAWSRCSLKKGHFSTFTLFGGNLVLFDHDEVPGVICIFVKKCQKMTSKIIDFRSKIFHLKATNEGIFSHECVWRHRENDVKTSFLHDFIMFSNSGHAESEGFCITTLEEHLWCDSVVHAEQSNACILEVQLGQGNFRSSDEKMTFLTKILDKIC